MKKESLLDYNLQFFAEPVAEPNGEPLADPVGEPNGEPTAEPSVPIEEQIQKLMNENVKLKKAQEKAASEAADYKKKYNASLTDVQKASLEKAEKEAAREEEFEKLRRENTVTKYEKNFLKLGYPEDLAMQAAAAQYDSDADLLFKIQAEHNSLLIKQKESEWMKSRPPVNAGSGGQYSSMTKEQIMAIPDRMEKRKAIASNLELF